MPSSALAFATVGIDSAWCSPRRLLRAGLLSLGFCLSPFAADPVAADPAAVETMAVEPMAAEPMAAEPMAAEPKAPAPRVVSAELDRNGLSIVFDQPMLTWSDDVDTLAAIRIAPAISCPWHWQDELTLICSLDHDEVGPTPATLFSVGIDGDLLWSQQEQALPATVLEVESERPSVSAWVDRWQRGWPEFVVQSEQPIELDALSAVLRVEDERGVDVPFTLQMNASDNARRGSTFRLQPQRLDRADVGLRLRIRPGLRGKNGPLPGIQDTLLRDALANERFRIRDVSCGQPDARPPLCRPGEQLFIALSQPLDAASLQRLQRWLPRGLVAVEPLQREDYRFFSSDAQSVSPGAMLALRVQRAEQHWQLALPDDLRSIAGDALGAAITLSIQSGDFSPRLRIDPNVLLVRPGQPVSPRIEAYNLSGGRVQQWSVGAELSLQQAEFARTRHNRPQRIAAPRADADVWRRGGLVQGEVSGWSYSVAYAAHRVVVADISQQLLVWVSEWDSGAPVVGATVELLQLDCTTNAGAREPPSGLTTPAVATTGADGTALLPGLGDPLFGGSDDVLVRVSTPDRRSVLPLQDQLPGSASDWQSYDGEQGRVGSYGITERPLYRPGETVRYQVWLRQRTGNRLLRWTPPAAVALQLQIWDGSVVLEVPAAVADEFSALSGSFTLPATMNDDYYCLHAKQWSDADADNGVCFEVSRFDAAALWVTVATGQTLAQHGQQFAFDVRAGFYSGGPAVGAAVQVASLLTPQRVESRYPQHADFRFIDPFANVRDDVGEQLKTATAPLPALAADGRQSVTLPLHMNDEHRPPIPFGRLEVTATVGYPGQSNSTSAPLSLSWSAFPRYLGLRLDKQLQVGIAPQLSARLIDAAGQTLPAPDLEVLVYPDDGTEQASDAAAQADHDAPPPLTRCRLAASADGEARGACAFTPQARQGYRFVARLADAAPTELRAYAGAAVVKREHDAGLSLIERSDDGTRVQVLLQQPYARAKVLYTLQHGVVLRHWVGDAVQGDTTLDIALDPAWSPGVTLAATVVELAARHQHGATLRSQTFGLKLPIAAAGPRAAVQVTLPATAAPGAMIELQLHNPDNQPASVAVAVVDAGLLARAPADLLEERDPTAPHWLGQLQQWGAATWFGWQRFPIPPGRGRAPWDWDYMGDVLDQIGVSGTRIAPANSFQRGAFQEEFRYSGPTRAGDADGRHHALRSVFADSAFWQADLRLQAGETRRLPFRMPDNLTRWQATAWSVDYDDGFGRSDAVVTASLAVETRLEVPSQLYPGDRAELIGSARNRAAQALSLDLQLRGQGAGSTGQASLENAEIGPDQLADLRLVVRPTDPGTLELTAEASSAAGRDAVMRTTPVLAADLDETRSQAGRLDGERRQIRLPTLPTAAQSPRLQLQIGRVDSILATGWTDALHAYPHRCWEQTLSRAVAAALAGRDPLRSAAWPDAAGELADALAAAPAFRAEDGLFNYFDGDGLPTDAGDAELSSYTLDAFTRLQALGAPVPQASIEALTEALEQHWDALWEPRTAPVIDWGQRARVAGALAAHQPIESPKLTALVKQWAALDWHARSQLVNALALQLPDSPLLPQQLALLRAAGGNQGPGRVIQRDAGKSSLLGSPGRDHCSVLRTLAEHDHSDAGAQAVKQLFHGLLDHYAGGVTNADTQAAAQCLLALDAALPRLGAVAGSSRIHGQADQQTFDAVLDARNPTFDWAAGPTRWPSTLLLTGDPENSLPLAWTARVDYQVPVTTPPPLATGFALSRRFDVWRNGEWIALDLDQPERSAAPSALVLDDWIRITLQLDTRRSLHFVAVTDRLPGAWQVQDMQLSGLAGIDLQQAAGPGSPWFGSRRTRDATIDLYAERVPPGQHRLHYYAQVRHRGDFLLPPASAELMYGEASHARTAAQRVRIGER